MVAVSEENGPGCLRPRHMERGLEALVKLQSLGEPRIGLVQFSEPVSEEPEILGHYCAERHVRRHPLTVPGPSRSRSCSAAPRCPANTADSGEKHVGGQPVLILV
jgi:hypothetical protein